MHLNDLFKAQISQPREPPLAGSQKIRHLEDAEIGAAKKLDDEDEF